MDIGNLENLQSFERLRQSGQFDFFAVDGVIVSALENSPNGGSNEGSAHGQASVLQKFQSRNAGGSVGSGFNIGKEVLVDPSEQSNDVVDQQEKHPKQFGDDDGKNDGRDDFYEIGINLNDLEAE